MPYPELLALAQQRAQLRDRWVAIDPAGGSGLAALRSGAVVVDFDAELDELCRRVSAAHRTALTIVYCGHQPRA